MANEESDPGPSKHQQTAAAVLAFGLGMTLASAYFGLVPFVGVGIFVLLFGLVVWRKPGMVVEDSA